MTINRFIGAAVGLGAGLQATAALAHEGDHLHAHPHGPEMIAIGLALLAGLGVALLWCHRAGARDEARRDDR